MTVAQNALVKAVLGTQVVVGRQPIIDRSGAVVGFELLYRAADPGESGLTGEEMTAQVVLSALTVGLDHLVGDKAIYCNGDRGVFTGVTPISLPPHQTVIEVLETVRIDDEVVAGCLDLLAQGYTLALDDFTWVEGIERLLPLVSVVKIDLLALGRDAALALAARCRPYGVALLAEKVERAEDLDWARAEGFDLFQGYIIERPKIVRGQVVAPTARALVRLAMMVLRDDLDIDELERVLRAEPSLTLQVLRMASVGARHGLSGSVLSLREALVLAGTDRARQWVALTLLSHQPGSSPDALAHCLVRARTCELLVQSRRAGSAELAFTAGMLSCLDLLLGVRLEDLVDDLDLDLDPGLTGLAFRHEGSVGSIIAEVAAHQLGTTVAGPGQDDTSAPDLVAAAGAAFAWAMPYVNAR